MAAVSCAEKRGGRRGTGFIIRDVIMAGGDCCGSICWGGTGGVGPGVIRVAILASNKSRLSLSDPRMARARAEAGVSGMSLVGVMANTVVGGPEGAPICVCAPRLFFVGVTLRCCQTVSAAQKSNLACSENVRVGCRPRLSMLLGPFLYESYEDWGWPKCRQSFPFARRTLSTFIFDFI
jgi:hypothetical protein